MLKSIAALLLVFLVGCANTVPYADWTPKEKTLYKYYLALQVIDTAQTGRVINCQRNNDRCTLDEANPVYGKRSSMEKLIGMKIGLNALFFVALGKEKIDRVRTLKILNTTMTIVVGHNQFLLNKTLQEKTMEYLLDLYVFATTIVTIASIVCNYTDTPKDDALVAKAYKVLEQFAFLGNKAKQ